jgi:sterol desaturase/sphingolipid hydroxylase (fatty acid hydroxylase superfamily)
MNEETFQLLRGAVFLFAVGLGLTLERVSRHAEVQPEWRTNLGLWAANGLAVGLVCGACACTASRWASLNGWGVLNASGVHVAFGAPLTVLLLDLVAYVWHRANHRVPLLWRFHRVHHADSNFHFSTALRFHPGEVLLSLPLRLLAILLLGAPVLGVLLFEALFMCANMLEHGNFNLPPRLERGLSGLVITPALHRWHHSREEAELNTNFGTILALWDRALQTFEMSDSRRAVRTGLPSGEVGEISLMAALATPFRGR